MSTVNIYEQFLKNAEDYLISGMPELSGKFIPINEIIEENTLSSYIIRPNNNFGVDTNMSNLRNYEQDSIFTFQIFKDHAANTDIVKVGQDIKNLLFDFPTQIIDSKTFNLKTTDLIINNDSQFDALNVQMKVNIY